MDNFQKITEIVAAYFAEKEKLWNQYVETLGSIKHDFLHSAEESTKESEDQAKLNLLKTLDE